MGGYDADPERLARVRAYFHGRGAATIAAPDPGQRHQRFSGTDEVRLAALENFVSNPDIDIVIALRGGYGVTRLLARIDFAAVARSIGRGKRFVGHSDFGAFQLALLARTGAASYAGPMASYDFGVDPAVCPVSGFTESHFWQMIDDRCGVVEFDCGSSRAQQPASQASPADFEAQGTLWGGNLAMLCSLIGTPWMPVIDGGLLFIEDINEHPYRVERMLLQLHQAGVLSRQNALLIGDFSGYRLTDYDNGYDFAAMLSFLRGVIEVPIVTGLPFGHCRDKLTLPVGGTAHVLVSGGVCKMTMRAGD